MFYNRFLSKFFLWYFPTVSYPVARCGYSENFEFIFKTTKWRAKLLHYQKVIFHFEFCICFSPLLCFLLLYICKPNVWQYVNPNAKTVFSWLLPQPPPLLRPLSVFRSNESIRMVYTTIILKCQCGKKLKIDIKN